MQVHVTLTNVDQQYRFAEYIDPYIGGDEMTVGDIYRAMQAEFGRCTGKVYNDKRITTEDGGERWETVHVGWCFLSRGRYEDTGESYLREAWVTLLHDPEPVKHYEIAPY